MLKIDQHIKELNLIKDLIEFNVYDYMTCEIGQILKRNYDFFDKYTVTKFESTNTFNNYKITLLLERE